MKTLLRLEEFLMVALVLFRFSELIASWGLFALLFFPPDLSMLGYLINPRLGAWILRPAQDGAYNLIHHKGTGITLYVLGNLLVTPRLMFGPHELRPHPRLRLEARRRLPKYALGKDRKIILNMSS